MSCKKSDHGPGVVWPRGHVTYVMVSALLANEKLDYMKWANEEQGLWLQFLWQQAAV